MTIWVMHYLRGTPLERMNARIRIKARRLAEKRKRKKHGE